MVDIEALRQHLIDMDNVTLRADVAREDIDGGGVMPVIGTDIGGIRGLGFIGLMTVGMHHQAHHLALASGQNPHDH